MLSIPRKKILGIVKRPSLGHVIHIALLVHLLFVGTLLSSIIGGTTYYLHRKETAEGVLETVRHQTEILTARTRQFAKERNLPVSEAAKTVLSDMQVASLLDSTGQFLFIEVCEADGSTRTLWGDSSQPSLVRGRCDPQGRTTRARPDVFSYEVVRRDARLYVLTRTSISVGEEPKLEEVLSTFLLSDGKQRELERTAIDRAMLAVAIVLLTTLATYPAILLLVRRIGKLTQSLLQSNLEILQVLGSAIAQRDSDTDEHNYRVTLYSVRLAEAAGVGRGDIRHLLKGAFLHDVGKIGIPDNILRKPGPLSDDEMNTMRTHVQLGLKTILRSSWLADAAGVVGCHHERMDGKGYPKGMAGEEIPLIARIFAIADVFDALCSARPYKESLTPETALEIMRQQSGKHFDQGLFSIFEGIAIDLHGRYASRREEELRVELNAVLLDAFSDSISKLAR